MPVYPGALTSLLHSSCQQPPKPSRNNSPQTGTVRRTPRFVHISQHWMVWEVLAQDFHPVCEVVFAHRIQRMWLKEQLWRGLLKNCLARSSPFALRTEIIAPGIRELYSASQVSPTIVGVDLPVGGMIIRTALFNPPWGSHDVKSCVPFRIAIILLSTGMFSAIE